MALTKVTGAIDVWAEIAQGALREGANINVSNNYETTLHIDIALSSTTLHGGTEIIVQTGTDTGDLDDNWSTLVRFIGVIGTAISTPFLATEPIGEKTIGIDNPATNNQDNDMKFKFIENVAPADSEIVFQTANSGDGGDTVTIQDGLTHEQDITTSIMYDIDDAVLEAVSMHQISIPITADRYRVFYNNNFSPGGSTVFTRCRETKVIAV